MADQPQPQPETPLQPNCFRCNHPFLETDVRAELPCHHFLHTTCLIGYIFYQGPHTVECDVCHTIAWTTQHEDPFQEAEAEAEAGEDTHGPQTEPETSRIQNLYATNDTFKKLAKNLARQRRILGRNLTDLVKFSKEKKGEIRNQLILLKAQLEGLTELKKSEIRNSDQYKRHVSGMRSYNLYLGKLQREYNCSERKIMHELGNLPGFRSFSPVRRSFYHRFGMRGVVWGQFYYRVRV